MEDLILIFIVLGLFFLAIYLYFCFALLFIARKKNVEHGWLSFIPFAQFYVMVEAAGLEWWWFLLLFAGVIPFIGPLIALGVTLYIFYKLAENLGWSGWMGLLLMVPIVNFVIIGMFAWKKP